MKNNQFNINKIVSIGGNVKVIKIICIMVITTLSMYVLGFNDVVGDEVSLPRITNAYKEVMPAMRFIGIMYTNDDIGENGTFGHIWREWDKLGHWCKLSNLLTDEGSEYFKYIGSTICLMTNGGNEENPFQYWLGRFFPPNTTVPEGFKYIDFKEKPLGVAWVYGKMPDVFFQANQALNTLIEVGVNPTADSGGVWWWFERYVEGRWCPDTEGNYTLDLCFILWDM